MIGFIARSWREILLGSAFLTIAYYGAQLFEKWVYRFMAHRQYGKPRPEDRVPEPHQVLWRRALDRAMSSRVLEDPAWPGSHKQVQCPFCEGTYEIPDEKNPSALYLLAQHLIDAHPARLCGFNKDDPYSHAVRLKG